MRIRTIIIDDEEPARLLVKNFLADFCEIEIVDEFADGFSGLKAINELKPDLVFLDIQMPKLTGFEILELAEHQADIIFTTAYDQYAINAFEANAVDYLLKPFNRDRFANAVKKAIDRYISKNKQQKKVKSVIAAIDEKPEIIDRIAVRTGTKIQVIPADEILYLEAYGDYVRVHTNTGSFLKEKTMKYFETHLPSAQFIRIHRSYIVNINQVERLEYYDKESYIAVLKNHLSLKVSSSGYKTIKEALNI